MILGIDTSAAQCAVALLGAPNETDAPLVQRRAMERGHAEHLFPMIEAILERAGTGYSALDRIAVCTGPGSFTGVRIGVAAARGLALGRGIPVVGISRFEALAIEAGGPVTVCLAGRGGTVYLQSFDSEGLATGAPLAIREDELGNTVAPGRTRFAGDAAYLVAGDAALIPAGLADPAIVARLSIGRDGEPLPAPLYMRGPDADLPRQGPPPMLD